MSIAQQVDEFCDDVFEREINKKSTLDSYERWVRRFETWRPGGQPDEQMVRDFDSFLCDPDFPATEYPWENTRGRPAPDEYSYSARLDMVSGCKIWFDWQYDTYLPKEPKNICKGEPAPFDPTIVPRDQIRRTIEAAEFDCDIDGCKAALQVSYDAILRGAELTRIRREDVDLDAGALKVRAVKGSNQATVGLSDRTVRLLRQHINKFPDREQLFYHSYGRPWDPQPWNNHVRKRHHEAGSHALFRHSPVCHRLNSGEEFGEVYRRARHAYPRTTTRYAKVIGVEAPSWATPD